MKGLGSDLGGTNAVAGVISRLRSCSCVCRFSIFTGKESAPCNLKDPLHRQLKSCFRWVARKGTTRRHKE